MEPLRLLSTSSISNYFSVARTPSITTRLRNTTKTVAGLGEKTGEDIERHGKVKNKAGNFIVKIFPF